MGWGTSFRSDVYISRVDVENADHAKCIIEDCQELINDAKTMLIGLAVATPHISSEESMGDMVRSMSFQVDDCVSTIVENAEKISLLRLYINGKEEETIE
jgi:hypothetical protein